MEIYNIRSLKIHIGQVIFTPCGNRFRLSSKFLDTSIQDCKYICLIYSGKQRFVEVGFNHTGVYKVLKTVFKLKDISTIVIRIQEFLNGINKQ